MRRRMRCQKEARPIIIGTLSRVQSQELQEVQEVIPQLSREAYFDFDTFVKKKIDSGEVEIIEHALDEDPRERVLLGKNGFAAS